MKFILLNRKYAKIYINQKHSNVMCHHKHLRRQKKKMFMSNKTRREKKKNILESISRTFVFQHVLMGVHRVYFHLIFLFQLVLRVLLYVTQYNVTSYDRFYFVCATVPFFIWIKKVFLTASKMI